MIRHILKLMWNRKNSLAWIFAEQTLVFGILLFCFIYCGEIITRSLLKGNVRLNNLAYVDFSELETTNLDAEEKKASFLSEFQKYFPQDQFKPYFFDLHKSSSYQDLFNVKLELYLFAIPTAFLLIFAFMGTFGVVWMQTKKRISEMGLRIALGSTPAHLMLTIILENLFLTTLAMLPGLIVVSFLYAYSPEGLVAVGAAIVVMWLFSVVSAWYPAWRAAKVQPVEALKAGQ